MRRLAQVVKYVYFTQLIVFKTFFSFQSIPGANQHWPAAMIPGRLQVAQAVADKPAIPQTAAEFRFNLFKHSGSRLAAAATVFGTVGAEENSVHGSAFPFHQVSEFLMDRIERREIEQTARESGLIGRQGNQKASAAQIGDGFNAARQWLPLRGAPDEFIGIPIDDSVPVQHYHLGGFATQSSEMSAT